MTRGRRTPRVLIIEDDEALLRLAATVLELAGFSVLAASSGDEGLALARDKGCNLVLLDLVMPGRDGWFVLDVLKNDPQLRNIPVVIFTASAHKAEADKALSVGASAYLVKPLSAAELVAGVSTALSDKETALVQDR